MSINSRQLCALVVVVLFVCGFVAFLSIVGAIEFTKGLLVSRGRRQSAQTSANQLHKTPALHKRLKGLAAAGSYVLWLVGVSYIFATVLNASFIFRDFEVILVLFAASLMYRDAKQVAVDEFWQKVRWQLTGVLIVDAFLSLHSYTLMWEAIFLVALFLLRFGIWFIKLATGARSYEDIDTTLGRRLYASLVTGLVGGQQYKYSHSAPTECRCHRPSSNGLAGFPTGRPSVGPRFTMASPS